MTTLSRLELAPLHRPRSGGKTERWSWDFVVDGQSLHARIGGDVVGALGWSDAVWESAVVERLQGRAAPDFPPDRVALYVCPECGELDCGAVTASITRAGDVLTWSNFAFQNGPEIVNDAQRIALEPFHFDRGAYGRLLREVLRHTPGPGILPLAVF